eukprot:TRINITY_DN18920_c0_g1_i1.p1 TRINITY_DN18920_c0_g1~~TRINITY_DN18920_c0_g1_i1.p1  ORF type:complete len:611 (-),score=78.34 TRINITY_DN18920_c0_g1_i1:1414-3246(-)
MAELPPSLHVPQTVRRAAKGCIRGKKRKAEPSSHRKGQTSNWEIEPLQVSSSLPLRPSSSAESELDLASPGEGCGDSFDEAMSMCPLWEVYPNSGDVDDAEESSNFNALSAASTALTFSFQDVPAVNCRPLKRRNLSAVGSEMSGCRAGVVRFNPECCSLSLASLAVAAAVPMVSESALMDDDEDAVIEDEEDESGAVDNGFAAAFIGEGFVYEGVVDEGGKPFSQNEQEVEDAKGEREEEEDKERVACSSAEKSFASEAFPVDEFANEVENELGSGFASNEVQLAERGPRSLENTVDACGKEGEVPFGVTEGPANVFDSVTLPGVAGHAGPERVQKTHLLPVVLGTDMERVRLIQNLSEAALRLAVPPHVLYFAVIMFDICLSETHQQGGKVDCVQREVLGLTCLHLAANHLSGFTRSPDDFCATASIAKGMVKACMIRCQLAGVERLLGSRLAGVFSAQDLFRGSVEPCGGMQEVEYMAQFVLHVAGSPFAREHFGTAVLASALRPFGPFSVGSDGVRPNPSAILSNALLSSGPSQPRALFDPSLPIACSEAALMKGPRAVSPVTALRQPTCQAANLPHAASGSACRMARSVVGAVAVGERAVAVACR